MTNRKRIKPDLNDYRVLVPLQSVDGNNLTSDVIDLGNAASDEIVALLVCGAIAAVDAAFVVIEESVDQVVWTRLVTMSGGNARTEQVRFRRNMRYIRAQITIETEEEVPEDATLLLTVVLLI